jgi:hypothetical protein
MCSCDLDEPEAISRRQVKARLSHECESCSLPIMSGEVYDLTSGVWDGDAATIRRHLLCASLEDVLRDRDGCGVELGGLREAPEYSGLSSTFRVAWSSVMAQRWPEDGGEVHEDLVYDYLR